MPLEAYSPGTVTVELGSDPVTTLVVELGTPGPQGQQGEPGQNGEGVPVGGSAGQVLVKIDGTDYNTEWADVVNPAEGFTLNPSAVIDANSGTVNLGAVNIGGPFAMEAQGYLYLQDGSKSVTIQPDNGITLAGGANLKFSDNSTQTTAFIDAPSDGNKYARKNGTWEQFNGGVWGQITGTLSNQTDLYNALSAKYDASNPSGYITVSALAPYLLSSTAASTYLTQSNASSTYLTQANASSTYLTQSNASSTYLTISSASATYFPKPTGTSAQYIDGSGVLQNFPTVTTAGKMVTSVRNNTGATLTKGTVVYINGAVGNKPTVAKAQANNEITSKATFAFIEADIANNADGNVVQIGLLENLDTQGFADGTLIYLSPTVAGGWTATQPFSPNHYVALGTVIRGNHPTLGSIQVRINNGFQLDEMSDVGAVSPTNNNVLTWNAATSQWLDKSISTILGFTPADDSLVLKKASNLSDLQSASVARGNLGLGTMAVETASNYLDKAGNLSGLASVSTARTNLGLGTMATATATDYLDKAGNLSGLANTTTARTNLGLAYATDAQVLAGTSTTTVVSPSSLYSIEPKWFSPSQSAYGTRIATGTVLQTQYGGWCNLTPTASGQYAIRWVQGNQVSIANSGTSYSNIDFSKRNKIYGRIYIGISSVLTNYWGVGRPYNPSPGLPVGDLTARGFGIRIIGTGAVELQVHNGTTLTNVTSSFTPTNGVTFDCLIDSLGNGTVNLYINDALVATTNAGANATQSGWPTFYQEVLSTASGSAGYIAVINHQIYLS